MVAGAAAPHDGLFESGTRNIGQYRFIVPALLMLRCMLCYMYVYSAVYD